MAGIKSEYQYVTRAVGRYLRVHPSNIRRRKGETRATGNLAHARAMTCVALTVIGYSQPVIAKRMGVEHTTVLRYTRRPMHPDFYAFIENLVVGRERPPIYKPGANLHAEIHVGPNLRSQWNSAVATYWARPEAERELYWKRAMRRVFPFSAAWQANVAPRVQNSDAGV